MIAATTPDADDSLVYDNRLLQKVAYPDESSALRAATSYEVSYSYNAAASAFNNGPERTLRLRA